MAKKNENESGDKLYYGTSVVSTLILLVAVLAYICGDVSLSEKVFILFIFVFGFELGLRVSRLLKQ